MDNFAVAEADLGAATGNLFGYAPENAATGALAATAALASGELAGPELINSSNQSITLRLGTFRDSGQVRKVAEAFAMLGAVDQTTATVGGDPATVLTLIRLKAGVSRQDVVRLAQELGLKDVILY